MSVTTIVNEGLSLVTLVIKGWAFADAAFRPAAAFKAVDKMPKLFWLTVLGLATVGQIAIGLGNFAYSWIGFVGLAGIVVALMYAFGIRPLVIQYGPRRKGGGRSNPSSGW